MQRDERKNTLKCIHIANIQSNAIYITFICLCDHMIEAWMAAASWLTDWLATSSFPTLLSAKFLSLLFVWLNANDYRLLLLFKIGSNRISHEFFAGRILLSSFSATTQVTSQRRATAFLLFFMRKRKMNKEFNAIVQKYLYQCCACAIQSFRSHSIMVVFFVIVWSCYELFVLHLSIPPCAHNITFIEALPPPPPLSRNLFRRNFYHYDYTK